MPAEAVHLSALEDSIARDAALGSADEELRSMQRLGSVLIDLAYFDRFAIGVLRYLAGQPIATSPVGDRLHQQRPVALGKHLLRTAARLRSTASTRRDGDRLHAVALGYFSHIAVDSRLHPLVNRLAADRAARLGDNPARQHNEVEKFHSILFHEQRFGFDFMGNERVERHIEVEAHVICDGGAIDRAYRDAIAAVHGEAPDPSALKRWKRGYAQYGMLLASWFGARIMPADVKDAVRGEVFDAPWGRFLDHYDDAVVRSIRYLTAAVAYGEDLEDAAFDRVVPEGSIDDPPYATQSDRGLAP